MVDATDIQLVQSSWEKVKPISDEAARLFYARLFELDPEAQSLFKGDMDVQGQKLMNMISMAVSQLNNLDGIIDMLQASGRRHVGYGVKDSQYETVGIAFLDTLNTGLGDAFTPEVKSAWVNVYTLMATTMMEAGQEVRN